MAPATVEVTELSAEQRVCPELSRPPQGRIRFLRIEHYLDFCLDVGNRFSIMDRGANVAEGLVRPFNDNIVKQNLTV